LKNPFFIRGNRPERPALPEDYPAENKKTFLPLFPRALKPRARIGNPVLPYLCKGLIQPLYR